MKSATVLLFGLSFLAIPSFAQSTTGLADWCFNINGNDNASNACNLGTGAALANVNLSSFDTTLEQVGNNGDPVPGTENKLGSAVITFGAGTSYLSAYMDYDLDFFGTACGGGSCGSFDDYASAVGTAPTGWTYELNDPNVSSIFSDFAGGALPDSNAVGTASSNPQCCDVAWALSIGNLPSQGGTLTFNVTTTAPTTGFYLQQTNATNGDSIYLSAVVTPNGVSTGTPEPATFGLFLGALIVLLAGGKYIKIRSEIKN